MAAPTGTLAGFATSEGLKDEITDASNADRKKPTRKKRNGAPFLMLEEIMNETTQGRIKIGISIERAVPRTGPVLHKPSGTTENTRVKLAADAKTDPAKAHRVLIHNECWGSSSSPK